MAITYRDIDNILRRYPGETNVRVSYANYKALTAITETSATEEHNRKKIVYRAAPFSAIPQTVGIHPSPVVSGDDILLGT